MLSITDALHWVERTPVAVFVSHSTWGFSALLSIHILAVAIVFGMIAMVDLRLIGMAGRQSAVTALCREALPWTWSAFALSVVTGTLLFTAQPLKYWANDAFRMKFAILALAGLNMLVFQLITYRGVARWDRDPAVPWAGRLAGAISLGSWIAIIAYGRWTAYQMT
jgi:hypothetical protein